MINNRVIIFGLNSDVYDRAVILGLAVTAVQRPTDLGLLKGIPVSSALICDYENDSSFLHELAARHRISPFAASLSFSERGMLPSALTAELLGIRGLDPAVVKITRDKLKMREALQGWEASDVRHRAGETEFDLRSYGATCGYPFIAKPRQGVASRGVTLVAEGEEQKAVARLGQTFIMEEFLEGPLLSIDCFSREGQHTILAINGMRTSSFDSVNPFLEFYHQIPADISEVERADVTNTVFNLLTSLGLFNGPSHTELVKCKTGFRVLETHTRFGGDHIPEMIERITSFDPISYALAWFAGQDLEPVPICRPSGGIALHYLHAPPGRVTRIDGLARARTCPGIIRVELNVEVGSWISPVEASNDRIGYVLAVDLSSGSAVARASAAENYIRIQTLQWDGGPPLTSP